MSEINLLKIIENTIEKYEIVLKILKEGDDEHAFAVHKNHCDFCRFYSCDWVKPTLERPKCPCYGLKICGAEDSVWNDVYEIYEEKAGFFFEKDLLFIERLYKLTLVGLKWLEQKKCKNSLPVDDNIDF